MRILKFLLTSIFLITLLGGIGFLLAREGLLFFGAMKVGNALNGLKFINKNQANYTRQCKLKGNANSAQVLSQLRLRFTSPREYQTEVLCEQFPTDPIVVLKDSLPPFVAKVSGFSGVIWGKEPSGIQLSIWGRQRFVGVVDEEVNNGVQFAATQLQPPTTCGGYSQVCCQNETQQGVGAVNDQVTDCPKSCFSSCVSRPVVLSFTSDPFFDQASRTLSLSAGTSVTFAFVVSSNQKLPPAVTVTYGDGQQETVTGLTGQFNHVYECANQTCTYTASLSIQDRVGIESAATPLTQLKVIVQ